MDDKKLDLNLLLALEGHCHGNLGWQGKRDRARLVG
jgi:hypothetical protein